jgi:RimJ/RimL family protein N-acetyltransferase
MPSFPDLGQPLRGPTAQLRLAAEPDIPEILIAHQDDPRLHEALRLERPPSGAELGRRVEHEAGERAAGAGAWLTILDGAGGGASGGAGGAGSGVCRGQVEVRDVDWDHLRVGLTIWVALADRGRGLGAGALALVGTWLLGACGIMRVELHAPPDNQALGRAATAAGFIAEGVLRGYLRQRRRRIDTAVYSLIPADLEGQRP